MAVWKASILVCAASLRMFFPALGESFREVQPFEVRAGESFMLPLFISSIGYNSFLRAGFGIAELTVLAQKHPPEWIFIGDRWGSLFVSFSDDLLMLSWNWNFGVSGLSRNWFWLRLAILPIRIGAVKTGIELGALGTLDVPVWALYVSIPVVYWFDNIGGSAALSFEWVRTDPKYWCVWVAASAYVDIIGMLSHLIK